MVNKVAMLKDNVLAQELLLARNAINANLVSTTFPIAKIVNVTKMVQ